MGDGASSSAGRGGGGGGESVVIDYGRRRTSCGYCRSTTASSISHGMWAQSLTADDYQTLLDRGWRRSGCFLYKPEMERTCCPSYTIRLKASDFICSKEQARVLKKMQRFLDGELDPKAESPKCKMSAMKRSLNDPKDSPTTKHSKVSEKEFPARTCQNLSKDDEFIRHLSSKINDAIDMCFRGSLFSSDIQLPKAAVRTVKPQIKKKVTEASADLVYTSNISFQIAAAIRRSLPKEKDASENKELLDISPNSIAEKLATAMEHHKETAGFVIKACNGHLNFYSTTTQAIPDHTIDASSQASKGECSSSKQRCVKEISQPQKRRKLEIRMKRSHFDPEEFGLYRRYQTKVHAEKVVSESSYRRFLVDTPIVFVPSRDGDDTVPPCGFGSFHQQYRVDGKLVAVGVVDILPKCLSSKYLFWDPDLAFLSLGKYTALKEIDWVKATQVHCPSLQYYYLGYYIHSCNKMRYKAAYRPSELLCPVRYEWVPYDIARPLLDRSSYAVLSDFARLQDQMPQAQLSGPSIDTLPQHDHDESLSDEDEADFDYDDSDMVVEDEMASSEINGETTEDHLNETDIGNIVLDLNGSRVKYKELQQMFGPIEKRHLVELGGQLSRYVKVVGKELSDRIVYSLG